MIITDRYNEALSYAETLHRSQFRKGTSIPYISHLMTVSALVLEHGGDEDQAIAGLLHDAVEDQGGETTLANIKTRFGGSVAAIVVDCTDSWEEPKPEWRPRKEAYIEGLFKKPQASLLVSLADKTHNAEAILNDYHEIGDDIWARFTGGKDGTHWYYQALRDRFAELIPGRLQQRLATAVHGFTD